MNGVFLNIITVIAGTALGLVFGKLIPERFRQIAFFAIGSCTIAFGAITTVDGFADLSAGRVGSFAALVLVTSLVSGSLFGELLRIEQRIEGLGGWLHRLLKKRFKRGDQADSSPSTFAEGFMTASIFFCVGAMTVMGSIQAGLGDPSTLYLKSLLDGISAIFLTTALGIGVGFSAFSVFIIQGGLAVFAGFLKGFLTSAVMASISLVGGTMLIALGIDIIGIKKMKVGNMLPALLIAVLLGWLLGL
ncbi:MAG: DUF554 domain-containing protein [Coriobacteriaceae bacterium]|nr:DUF554 domain-containing protein [Coriobacteriaceae bacterium]